MSAQDQNITLRNATQADFDAVYDMFQAVLKEGSTYSYSPEEMTRERSHDYWMGAHHYCIIAEIGGETAGFYTIRPNRTGRAKHVANASFIVSPDFRNRGVGRTLGERAIAHAKEMGYQAMQFNFVVSANEVAVKLWQSLGFQIVGTLPKGFQHASKGLVNVYIMHRFL